MKNIKEFIKKTKLNISHLMLLIMIVVSSVAFSYVGYLSSQGTDFEWSFESPYLVAALSKQNQVVEADNSLEEVSIAKEESSEYEEDYPSEGEGLTDEVEDMNLAVQEDVYDTETSEERSVDTTEDKEVEITEESAVEIVEENAVEIVEENAAESAAESTEEPEEVPEIILPPAENPGRCHREQTFVSVSPWQAKSRYYEDGDSKPANTVYPYITVDNSYYDDALFIGDSRIEGLSDYGGLDTATFAYKTGLNVFSIYDETLVKAQGETRSKESLEAILQEKQYAKIFLMIGVNELGNGFASQYADKYVELIEFIRKYDPQAVIEIMGIMYMTKACSDESNVFNNDNINSRNTAVVNALPDDDAIIYLDMNEAVCDETGDALSSEYSHDGVHLTAKYYVHWTDFLNSHGLSDEMFLYNVENSNIQ